MQDEFGRESQPCRRDILQVACLSAGAFEYYFHVKRFLSQTASRRKSKQNACKNQWITHVRQEPRTIQIQVQDTLFSVSGQALLLYPRLSRATRCTFDMYSYPLHASLNASQISEQGCHLLNTMLSSLSSKSRRWMTCKWSRLWWSQLSTSRWKGSTGNLRRKGSHRRVRQRQITEMDDRVHQHFQQWARLLHGRGAFGTGCSACSLPLATRNDKVCLWRPQVPLHVGQRLILQAQKACIIGKKTGFLCLANLVPPTKKLESEGEQLPSASNYEPYMCTSYNPLVADGGCDMGYQPYCHHQSI
jgi:hypothetical protein